MPTTRPPSPADPAPTTRAVDDAARAAPAGVNRADFAATDVTDGEWAVTDVRDEGFVILDAAWAFTFVNDQAERMLGRPREALLGRVVWDVLPDAASATIWRACRRAIATRTPVLFEGRSVVINRWIDAYVQPLDVGFAVHFRDATERRRALEVLRASEARYRLLFENHPLPLWVYDVETLRFLAVNDAAVAAYGYTRAQFAEMTLLDIRPPEDIPVLRDQLARPQPTFHLAGRFRHRRRDGAILYVELAAHSLEWNGRAARLVLAMDVTERTRLEAQLRHVDKMDAVGQLAGGVAHDFNNLLTAIVGNLELAAGAVAPGSDVAEDIAEAARAAQRAASLTRQLLVFSRKQSLQLRHLDANAIVREAERMLRRAVGETVRLVTDLASDVGTICADAGQLEQAVLNLVLNARDALAPAGGGTIAVSTRNLALGADEAARSGLSRGGLHVALVVRDNGAGMDAATQARIFEPFFTTKPVGKGTGLGLAMVHGFVVQSGGAVRVQSAPGAGSTFELLFPRIDAAAVRAAGAPRDAATTTATTATVATSGAVVTDAAPSRALDRSEPTAPSSATLLLAEDEAPVRVLARRVLEREGYRVLDARHGVDALALWRAHRGAISLLLTDVRMPEMGGRELAAAVRAEQPDLPVLFMSGYLADLPAEVPERLVEKPFTADQLLTAVRAALEARTSGAARRDARR